MGFIMAFGWQGLGQTFIKQHTYLDALTLRDIYIKLNNHEANTNQLNEAFDAMMAKYQIVPEQNVFFRYLMRTRSSGQPESTPLPPYQQVQQVASTSFPVNFQASVINGVAQFMANRFKQEVLQMALDKMFDRICSPEYVKLQYLFPKTYQLINELRGKGNSAYYAADLSLLLQAAQMDMDQLPTHLVAHSDTIFPVIQNDPNFSDVLKSVGVLVQTAHEHTSITQALPTLAASFEPNHSDVAMLIHVADLISQSLINVQNPNSLWVNPLQELPLQVLSDLNIKDSNVHVWYFYGLLYHQLSQIPLCKSYLGAQETSDPKAIATKINELLKSVASLQSASLDLANSNFQLTQNDTFFAYIKKLNTSVQQIMRVLLPAQNNDTSRVTVDKLMELSDSMIALSASVAQKDFQKAIAILMIDFGHYISPNHAALRPIQFMAQLATVQNAESMNALLESYALPIGSASIKRRSAFNISLNAYVGFSGGIEAARTASAVPNAGNIGLSAPIGIATSFFQGKMTALATVVDLGSIVNQRLNGDATSYSNVKFEQFLTPGLGLFYNIPKWPVSVGFHYCYVPNLRTIKYQEGAATITETNISVSRFNVALLIDIPFFTLYNKEK